MPGWIWVFLWTAMFSYAFNFVVTLLTAKSPDVVITPIVVEFLITATEASPTITLTSAPTHIPSFTPEPTSAARPTATPALKPTATPTYTPSPTHTATPTITSSPTPTSTPNPTLFPLVALLSAHGRYVTAMDESYGWALHQELNRDDPCAWFRMISQPDGRIAFYTCHDRYITAPDTTEGTRAHLFLTQESDPGDNGLFTMQDCENGTKAFVTKLGLYITAGDGGWEGDLKWKLVAETDRLDTWEKYNLVQP